MASETKDGCLQELERLNKEIETVKHEVEKEQRRLSRYQTEQTDCRNSVSNFCVSKSEMASKNEDRDSCRPSACTDLSKRYSIAKKYVIDNSKPRTDLEYDPLSNFSADLRSYSSSSKDQKVKNGYGVKRARDVTYSDQKKPLTHRAQFSQSPSPELLDDSREDDVLIIDIPPSPEKKRGRAQKPSVDDVGRSLDLKEDFKEVKSVPIIVDSQPLRPANHESFKVTSPCAATVEDHNHCGAKKDKDPSNISVGKDDENEPIDVTVIDLSRCLEDLRSRSCNVTCFQTTETVVEKSQETESLPAVSDSQDLSHNSLVVDEEVNTFCDEISHCEMPCHLKKVNPVQPCSVPQNNLLTHKTHVANSFYPYDQHTKQSQKMGQADVQSIPSALSSGQKMPSQTKGQMQAKAAVNHDLAQGHLELTNAVTGSSQYQTDHGSLACNKSHLTAESSSTTPEKLSLQTTNEEVIIIDSSSEEEEELNYSDMEVSDSDPMEECYRIFIEANKEEKGNVEPPHTPVSMMRQSSAVVKEKKV